MRWMRDTDADFVFCCWLSVDPQSRRPESRAVPPSDDQATYKSRTPIALHYSGRQTVVVDFSVPNNREAPHR